MRRLSPFAQNDSTFSTDVKVVNVLATVRNSKGEIVRDLTKDDFSLKKTRTLKPFAISRGKPIYR